METVFWLSEYGKVLFAYVMLMFVWPSVVFRGYLRDKSRTIRFAFCVTVQIVIVNTVVLCFGLLHILNAWTIRAFFYGIFLWSVLRKVRIDEEKQEDVRRLLLGTQGIRLFLLRVRTALRDGAERGIKRFWKSVRAHALEYLLLGTVVIYGMVYFTYGAFQDYSYGFGDMYLHHSWIYFLTEGQIFPDGIYPEAMHCFLYTMHTLFGARIYSCLLFVAGIHTFVFLLSVYCLLKEIFHWRYTAVFVLTMFLTVDVVCVDEIFSMSRLQWTLPQEFGLYTQFLCALFLVRYLKTPLRTVEVERGKKKKIKKKRRAWNAELLLFMFSLAASFEIHTYATVMAFFLCLSFALCAFWKIFRPGYFRGLAAAVVCGALIAVMPMGIAFATGIPFQGSINWAVNIINGTDTKEGRTQQAEGIQGGGQPAGGAEGTGLTGNGGEPSVEGGTGSAAAPPGQPAGGSAALEKSFGEKLSDIFIRLPDLAREKWQKLYEYGYVTLYRTQRAQWIVGLTLLAAALFLIYRIISIILCLTCKKSGYGRQQAACFDGYPPMILASLLFMILYAAPFLGLPELVAGSRLCSTEQMLLLTVIAMPVDMVFSLFALIRRHGFLHVVSVFCVGGIYAACMYFGVFHGYLYYELTRYNSVVMVTDDITKKFPKDSYTIVSCTDEIYQVIQYGYHEELLEFLQSTGEINYTLPTPYIFIYVEKRPIQYAQSHFFTGPDWLAWEKYTDYYHDYFSEGDSINASEISKEKANEAIMMFYMSSQSYSNLESRTILQSKMYRWCQRFWQRYENEMCVYYEDDDFVCYLIEQNPYNLFRLEEN